MPHRPRKGSMAFYPRVRAKSIVARIRSWPKVVEGPSRLLSFAAYKVRSAHVVMVEDRPGPYLGREVVKPAIILESPPLTILALRAYEKSSGGLRSFAEAWAMNIPKDVGRVVKLPNKQDMEGSIAKIEGSLGKVSELRVLACTQPRKSGIGKKTPEIFEIKIGGGLIEEQFKYVKNILGKDVKAKDVFKEGQFIDVIGVSKGKGVLGPVRRFGVSILPRKTRKTKRGPGAVGTRHPAGSMRGLPRAGQTGFHQRTEFNKRILKIGEDGEAITKAGGFPHYGVVRSDYIIISGSVPGPPKRLIKLRYPIRPPKYSLGAPKIISISTLTKEAFKGP